MPHVIAQTRVIAPRLRYRENSRYRGPTRVIAARPALSRGPRVIAQARVNAVAPRYRKNPRYRGRGRDNTTPRESS